MRYQVLISRVTGQMDIAGIHFSVGALIRHYVKSLQFFCIIHRIVRGSMKHLVFGGLAVLVAGSIKIGRAHV